MHEKLEDRDQQEEKRAEVADAWSCCAFRLNRVGAMEPQARSSDLARLLYPFSRLGRGKKEGSSAAALGIEPWSQHCVRSRVSGWKRVCKVVIILLIWAVKSVRHVP